MDNKLAVPPRAPGANLYHSSHSEKKLLARAKVQRCCWGADFTGTAVALISQALLSGLESSSPGKHMKPNPTGMRIHSLAQRKGAGGEQQTSTRGIPRQSQVRGKGAELCQSSHPRTSGHSPSSSAGSTEQPERKQLHAAEPARTRRTLGKAAGVQAERLSAGRHARQRKHRLQQRRGKACALPPQQS